MMAEEVWVDGERVPRNRQNHVRKVLVFISGISMATLMLASLILVSDLILRASPADPLNRDGQTFAVLVFGLVIISAYTMIFAALRSLVKRAMAAFSRDAMQQKGGHRLNHAERDQPD